MNNNNYKIIRTIYENVFQRVLECKDNTSNDTFYNNVITSDKVINLINIEVLREISTNIIECKKTDDRIYIVTRPLETENKNIKDYIKNNNLTLKQQFALAKNIINLSSDIFNMTDIVQQKILDLDKIYIDKDGQIVVDCNLIFEQEYDISDNETLKRMGNIIHFIFSGSEIVDYNISEMIPPDILKIIVRCLTREYMYPKNAMTELITSPIYKMIYTDDEIKKDEKLNKDLVAVTLDGNKINKEAVQQSKEELMKLEVENDNISEDDNGILNIYLNNNTENNNHKEFNNECLESNEPDKRVKKSGKLSSVNKEFGKIVTSLLVVIVVLLLGRFIMNMLNNGGKDVPANSNSAVKPNENTEGQNALGTETEAASGSDSTDKFLSKDLVAKQNYKGTVAAQDKEIYLDGDKSLIVKNESDEKIKALFATVDFTDQNYSYMLKQQIGVSIKVKSESDTTALIVLEAYKDGKLASTFHTSVQIYDDMWSPVLVPINVTNADSLNIYLEYSGKNKVWIDSVNIDVIK